MKQMSSRTFAIATSAFACATLLSLSWSEQSGVSLSVESAQARVGRPLTPVSVAGVARRQARRGAYGYGAGVVGAGVAAPARCRSCRNRALQRMGKQPLLHRCGVLRRLR